jgi:hypothetical protein
MVVPGTNCSQKNLKNFSALKKGIFYRDKLPKKYFFEFFFEFLGDLVPWYLALRNRFFLQISVIYISTLIILI